MDLAESLRHPRKMFFGWWTVLATGVMSAWSFAVVMWSFGLYYEPLQNEFGWTRAEISSASALTRFEGAGGPFIGYFTDKYGPRVTFILGFLIMGSGLCLLYFVDSLWSFLIIYGFIIGLGFTFSMSEGTGGKALANWFVKKRGLASGIMRAILGLGGFLPPVVLTLMMLFGWRMASLIAGFVTWGVCIPLTWFFVRPHRPEFYGLLPDGATVNADTKDTAALIRIGQEYAANAGGETEFTARQAMRTRAFWVRCTTISLAAWTMPLLSTQVIPYLTDMGVDRVAVTTAIGMSFVIGIPGRFIGGFLSDRISLNRLKYLQMISAFFSLCSTIILMFARDLWMVYVFIIVYGLAMGLRLGSMTPISGRYFGRKAFATISGNIALITLPFGIIAPIYVGWIYDTAGSYVIAFEQAVIIGVITTILWYFFDPPKRVDVVSDLKKLI